MREILMTLFRVLILLSILYLFFVAIKLMGSSAKGLGKVLAKEFLNQGASSALLGLFLGIFTTSLVQSSSTVTSMVVGLVAGGAFPLRIAIPIIMGANIGTTVTNTIVSLGHIHHRAEFRRAFGAGTVHDIFNMLAVLVLFPLEQMTHFLEKGALFLSGRLAGLDVGKFDGIKHIVDPALHLAKTWIPHEGLRLLASLVLLLISLTLLTRFMRAMMEQRLAHMIDSVLFRNALTSMAMGLLFTLLVQSSSVTTSLVVPLVGAGILSIRQIFPYTLGSNVGTTITALMAALVFAATGSDPVASRAALTAAFVHTLFNISGILIWYPFRSVPIRLARRLAIVCSRSRRNTVLVILSYIALYLLPFLLLLVLR
ncbi:MAG: Na/Pi symporter [Candidatus Krumholzibacteria bacterium]|nr:Na/Pi symporter [Candidatus Krumholzibacteria bacterium]